MQNKTGSKAGYLVKSALKFHTNLISYSANGYKPDSVEPICQSTKYLLSPLPGGNKCNYNYIINKGHLGNFF